MTSTHNDKTHHRLARDAEEHVAAQYAAFVETAQRVSAKRQQLQQCKTLWRTFAQAACSEEGGKAG